MKNKILIMVASATLLSACANTEEDTSVNTPNENNTNVESEKNVSEMTDESNEVIEENLEETEAENADVEEDTIRYSLEKLNGTYMLTTNDDRVRVILDDGTLRYTDGRGNVRYRLSNSEDRLVIAGDVPSVYLIKNNNSSIRLINVDEDGNVTGEDINLEIME